MMNIKLGQCLPLVFLSFITALAVLALVPLVSENPYFILSIPFACGLLVFVFMRTERAIILFLFIRVLVDPFLESTKVAFLSNSVGVGGVLNIMMVFLATLLIFNKRREFRRYAYWLKPWAIFMTVCAFSVLYSPLPLKATKSFVGLLSSALIFAMPLSFAGSSEDCRRWVRILLICSVLPVLLCDFGLMTHYSAFYHVTLDAGLRLKGPFDHANTLAFYASLFIAIVLYYLRSSPAGIGFFPRGLLYACVLNLTVILVATKTRSAWLSVSLFFVVYGILKERRWLVIMLVAIPLLLLTPQVQSRLSDLFAGSGERVGKQLNSLDWRVELWKKSMPFIRQKPIMGSGLGSFGYYAQYFPGYRGHGTVVPHNIYLQLAFETGLLGLLSYLAIFASILAGAFRKLRTPPMRSDVTAALLIAYTSSYLVLCFSDNMLYYITYNWYFLFFIGLLVKRISLPVTNMPKEVVE